MPRGPGVPNSAERRKASRNDAHAEEEIPTASRPKEVAKFILQQEKENEGLKTEVKRLKRETEEKDECIRALASSLKDARCQCRENDALLKESSQDLSRAIETISAVEHVLQNAVDYVEVASSSTPAAVLFPHEVATIAEEYPGLSGEPSPGHRHQVEVNTENDGSTAMLDAESFFSDDDIDKIGQRPLGEVMSLPAAIPVSDVEISQSVEGVLTSLEASSDIREFTNTDRSQLHPLEDHNGGAVGRDGPLPSFSEIRYCADKSVPFASAFDDFLRNRKELRDESADSDEESVSTNGGSICDDELYNGGAVETVDNHVGEERNIPQAE